MPRVKIRQLEERIATKGLHFGRDPCMRKLQPGEVVDIPEGDFLEMLWSTGKLELTRDPVTRPLRYESEREARLCSPTFKPRDPSEEAERDRALLEVDARLAGVPRDEDESPATGLLSPAEDKPVPSHNRRAARRAAREQQVST